MRTSPIYSERSGRPVANQNIIHDDFGNSFFQSYNSIIAKITSTGQTILDRNFWIIQLRQANTEINFLMNVLLKLVKK